MRRSIKRLPTAAKLLLLISLALLPLGLGMIWATQRGLDRANTEANRGAEEQEQAAARAIEGLIARNALALRVAANAALASTGRDDCEEARRALEIAPGVSRSFSLNRADGSRLCARLPRPVRRM